jgi:hypothetical protein
VDLRETLAALRDAGVAKAVLERESRPAGDTYCLREVEFFPEPPGPAPVATLTDEHGKPIDFDADMPPLGRDMVAEANLSKPAS